MICVHTLKYKFLLSTVQENKCNTNLLISQRKYGFLIKLCTHFYIYVWVHSILVHQQIDVAIDPVSFYFFTPWLKPYKTQKYKFLIVRYSLVPIYAKRNKKTNIRLKENVKAICEVGIDAHHYMELFFYTSWLPPNTDFFPLPSPGHLWYRHWHPNSEADICERYWADFDDLKTNIHRIECIFYICKDF